MVEFKQASGGASGEDGSLLVGSSDKPRSIRLLLDDTNWIIERALTKRANKAARSKVPFVGETKPFTLGPGQELYVFARLNPAGGAGSQWDLSVVIETEGMETDEP